jgi:hypothetical protein
MDFKNKYLKYKKKYLDLKDLLGGSPKPDDKIFEIYPVPTDHYNYEFNELKKKILNCKKEKEPKVTQMIKMSKNLNNIKKDKLPAENEKIRIITEEVEKINEKIKELKKSLNVIINKAYTAITKKTEEINSNYKIAFIFEEVTQLINNLFFYFKDIETMEKTLVLNIYEISKNIKLYESNKSNYYFNNNFLLSAYINSKLSKNFTNQYNINIEPKIKGATVLYEYYRFPEKTDNSDTKPSYDNSDTNDEYYKKLMEWIEGYKTHVDNLHKQYLEEFENYKAYINYKTSSYGLTGTSKKPVSLTNFPDDKLTLIKNFVDQKYEEKNEWLSNIWAKLA